MRNRSGLLHPGPLLLVASLTAVPLVAICGQADNTDAAVMLLGARAFDENCSKCHQPDGFGESGLYPSLHDPALLDDPETLIRSMLHGRSRPDDGVEGSQQALMPALDYLTNAEIVAIIAFISSSWGSAAVQVTEQDVQAARDDLAQRGR